MSVTSILDALAGTWQGAGEGSYPTIDDFRFTEELVITPVAGKPIAHWRSRTADGRTGQPRHAESGFLRATDGRWELVLAHSFGVTEIATGSVDAAAATHSAGATGLDLASTKLMGVPGAKRIDHVRRNYVFDGDTVTYRLAMAAVGVPLTHHLAAELHRGS